MNVKRSRFVTLFVFVLVLVMVISTAAIASALTSSIIDFEGLTEGQIVSSVSFGNGISGADAGGSVSVDGVNPHFPGQNAAMIFDSECLPSGTASDCSGGDDDLRFPGHGNVLIVSEDMDSSDPDDADLHGALLEFDFSGWGPGSVTVVSIDVGDVEGIENGGFIEVFAGGISQGTVGLPTTGDNVIQTIAVGLVGDFMRVTLNGSGAIDNIEIMAEEPPPPPPPPPPPGPGTGTPGYWMNHPEAWPVDEIDIGGTTYSRDDAIMYMMMPVKGDKTLTMFPALVSAKLNVLIGNDDSCVADTIAAADAWMTTYPVGSGVKGNSDAWKAGEPLYLTLDAYNNGYLPCADHRD